MTRYIPGDEPIDLLNVAFENPRKQRKHQSPKRKKKGKPTVGDHIEASEDMVPDPPTSYLVPDRETGLEGLAELRRLCPHRVWNFVRREMDRTPTRRLTSPRALGRGRRFLRRISIHSTTRRGIDVPL